MPRSNRIGLKYSELRDVMNIPIHDDEKARITHYLQNYASLHNPGIRYDFIKLDEISELENLIRDSGEQFSLFIDWDIPFPPVHDPRFTFIDLFAGIGGIRLAYQQLGGRCVFSSEWDKYAKITYEQNFGEIPYGDIRNIDESAIPDHDILLAGFPCQPFSIAGVSKKNALGREHGFKDLTQGTLFFDIARILDARRPKAFMLENVKNLKSHDKGKTFRIITDTLTELDYHLTYRVLDSKHFVPQHRERIIITGIRKDILKTPPDLESIGKTVTGHQIKSILEVKPDVKYTLSDHLWQYLQDYANKHRLKGNGFGYGLTDLEGISRTLSARYYKDGSEILIPQKGKNPRKLTPRECARLQGFPDRYRIPVSDTQAYKQFGNSVTVPLIYAVGQKLIESVLQ